MLTVVVHVERARCRWRRWGILCNLFRVLLLSVLFSQAKTETILHQQRQGRQQKEHLKRREICRLHTSQVVADHIAGSQHQVADAAEHTSVTHTPHIEKEQSSLLKRETANTSRLSAPGTEITDKLRLARGASMPLLRKRFQCIRPVLPDPESPQPLRSFLLIPG